MTSHLISAARNSYTVVYRTGGCENAVWRATMQYPDRDTAEREVEDVRRMGYKAMVWTVADVLDIGLPEGWDGAR